MVSVYTRTHRQKHKFAHVYESHTGYIEIEKCKQYRLYFLKLNYVERKKKCSVCVFLCDPRTPRPPTRQPTLLCVSVNRMQQMSANNNEATVPLRG